MNPAKTRSDPRKVYINSISKLISSSLKMIFTGIRIWSILLLSIILYFTASCNNDPVQPTTHPDADSLNLRGDLDIPNEIVSTDSAFYNHNGKILDAVCYGPFRDGQGPGSELANYQIKEDLLIMEKHWDAFRMYITDYNAKKVLKVLSENSIDLKVMLGVWISGNDPEDNAKQVQNAIKLANAYPEIVMAISCGNEIFGLPGSDIFVSNKSEIIGYLNDMKDRTNVPVTINDIYFVWTNDYYSDVVAAVDFLTIHLYGQWSNIPLENTITHIDDIVHQFWKKFPGKEIVIGETGWTTNKNTGQFGPVANETSQKIFYEQCQAWSALNKVTVFYFEAFDERWKGDTDTEAETNWGLYYANRTPKLVFQKEN